jgi:ketosteroid isomerase-like protein
MSADHAQGAPSVTHPQSPAAVAERLVNAFANADLPAVLAELADEFVMEMPAAPPGAQRVIRGREEITTLVGHVSTTWKGVELIRFAAHPLVDDPERVLAEYALVGTNLDDSTYRNDYTAVITVRDGKAVHFVEFFDPDPIVSALDALRAHLRTTRTA